jgi:opacity protein-like surface antigen
MKKILSLIVVSLLLITSKANAKDGAYVGVDLLASHAQYKLHNLYSLGQSRVDSNYDIGVGASVGYKKSFNQFFVTPEIFYDYLNSSTKDYHHNIAPYDQDTMEIRSRYGVKANFGYDFTNKFSGYLSYGMAMVDHLDNFPSVNDSLGKWQTAAIYGVGSIYNISNNWGIKTEFNSQRFNTRYQYYGGPSTTSKVRLNVLKVGLVYLF